MLLHIPGLTVSASEQGTLLECAWPKNQDTFSKLIELFQSLDPWLPQRFVVQDLHPVQRLKEVTWIHDPEVRDLHF